MRTFLLIFILTTKLCASQSDLGFGILPCINVSKKFQKDWVINARAESRISIVENFDKLDYTLTDLIVTGGKKIGSEITLMGGYLLRLNENDFQHRTIQQLIFSRNIRHIRISNRVSTDQTFSENLPVIYRLRYRLSTELPLSGQTVDPKEFFIKINHEYLGAYRKSEFDLEIRNCVFIGYVVNSSAKIEFGIDHRVNSFFDYDARNRIWNSINFFYSL